MDVAAAFNKGCDYRLAGRDIDDNPYVGNTQLWNSFRWGWNHVESAWGLDAKWEVMPLPRVKRYA